MKNERVSIAPRPSRQLLLALTGAHLAAAMALALAVGPGITMLCGGLALLASYAWLLLQGRQRIQARQVVIEAAGLCRWLGRDGQGEGTMRADTVALPWLVILRIDVAGTRWPSSIVLCPDSLPPDEWRSLRVFLRWGVRFGGAAPAPSGGPY